MFVQNLDADREPPHAQLLADLGTKTAEAIKRLWGIFVEPQLPLFKRDPEDMGDVREFFSTLYKSVKEGWEDGPRAEVIDHISQHKKADRKLDLVSLGRWLRTHANNADAVAHCMAVEPPDGMSVIRLLSLAGSQKVVFLSNWQIAQREVVLKRFIGADAAKKLIPRELIPHPLSMAHPNIIETHLLSNSQGESFLVERRLPMVLHDEWNSQGTQEAANLLRDISNALSYLHEKPLVHGDVKPDNIGLEDGRFILLDFGICRTPDAFDDTPATGSLRTRAPEILLGTAKHSAASDVWALGATVFNSIVGRFPLFNPGEKPPRITDPPARAAFEAELVNRISREWDARVRNIRLPEPLREPLFRALDYDHAKRITAIELLKVTETELAAFLRPSDEPSGFTPSQQLSQLKKYLPHTSILKLMPESQKRDLIELLNRLEVTRGLTRLELDDIITLRGLAQ